MIKESLKKYENEIHNIIKIYIHNNLSITDKKFCELVANAFINDNMVYLRSILENNHIINIKALISTLSTFQTNEDTILEKKSIKRFKTKKKLDILKDVFSNFHTEGSTESSESYYVLESFNKDLPKELIPSIKKTKERVRLKGFIYKMESELKNNDSDKNEIEDKILEIIECLKTNDIIIVQGDTGCGKTTLIPEKLLKHYDKILCTQPRQIAAISAAERVASMLNSKVGDLVGYRVRFDDKTSMKTRLIFATDGVLLNELSYGVLRNKMNNCNKKHNEKTGNNSNEETESLINKREYDKSNSIHDNEESDNSMNEQKYKTNEKTANNSSNEETDSLIKKCEDDESNSNHDNEQITNNNNYDLIIIDEAHERSLNIDFLLGCLKMKKICKLIVMSATLNTNKFIDYFNCPSININHKMYPISYFYLKQPTKSYFKSALTTVFYILKKFEYGDILVFLTGYDEIEEGIEILKDIVACMNVEVLRLYSAISLEEQKKVFKEGKRKVILSTNIAETSITIKTIRFVVDSGKTKQLRQIYNGSVNQLQIVNISRDQAKQRGGRAGRTGPGMVFRLYTYSEYLAMEEYQKPDILRLNLHGVILALKNLGINNPVNFDYIDRPPLNSILQSIKFLYYLRAINGHGKITNLGKKISNLPLSPDMSMVLLSAKKYDALDIVSTIIAFLCVGSVFIVKNEKKIFKKKTVSDKFYHEKGELYSYLRIYYEWKHNHFSKKFLTDNFLKPNVMEQILNIKGQLMYVYGRNLRQTFLKLPGIEDISVQTTLNSGVIEKAFCSGFFMNVARSTGAREYKTIFGDIVCYIHHSDLLYSENPKYVLFYEIMSTHKIYMRRCLKIDANTLFMACNNFD